VQALPSWPETSFFVLPTTERDLKSVVDRVDAVVQEVVSQVRSFQHSTPLQIEEALSSKVAEGAWLFQARNMDPLANIGPLAVTIHSSRCEGRCAAGVAPHTLSATAVSMTPPWRQPLCNPDITRLYSHQGCVPIVFAADMIETLVTSTVALRWPDLLTQWLAPVAAVVLFSPALLLVPQCAGRVPWKPDEPSTAAEVKSLVPPDQVGFTAPQLDFGDS